MIDELNLGSTAAYPSSTKLFFEWFRRLTNSTASIQTVGVWGAFDVLEAALYRAAQSKAVTADGVISPAEILSQLTESQVITPYGRVVFDSNRVNTATPAIVVQSLPSSATAEIVYPSGVLTAQFVYPMPTWAEREYKWQLVRGAAERISIAIASACSFVLLAMLVTICIYRQGERLGYLYVCLYWVWELYVCSLHVSLRNRSSHLRARPCFQTWRSGC